MGKSSSTPAPTDPYSTAAAQTLENEATASYNKVLNGDNSSNYFGSTQQTQTGTDPTTGAPIYTSTSTPNGSLSSILSGLLGTAGNSSSLINNAQSGVSGVNDSLSGLLSQYSGVGSSLDNVASTLAGTDTNSTINNAINAYENSATSYLDPQWSQATEQNNAQLAAQGITAGSDAYNNNQTLFNNSRTQAYQQALDNSITSGTNLGISEQNAASNSANAQTNALTNEAGTIGDQASDLSSQASNLFSLLGSSGDAASQLSSLFNLVPGNATTTSSANTTDIASLINQAYQQQLNSDNASNASANETTSGLASAAGTAAMLALLL